MAQDVEGILGRLRSFGPRVEDDDDVLRGDDDDETLEDLVQRNIRDVLEAARADDPLAGPRPSSQAEPRTSRPAAAARLSLSGNPAGGRAPSSSGAGPGPGSAGGPRASSAHLRSSQAPQAPAADAAPPLVLDVPGHADATIRLHKARIKQLEEELGRASSTIAEKDRSLVEATRELKALRAEQANWGKAQKALEAQAERHRKAAAEAEAALTARDQAVKDLSKEGGRAEKERRAAEAEVRARDVRLQRALEEVERYKAMLAEARGRERDGKDIAKGDYNRLVAENKKLERQRAELVVAFKKQLKLIDVLKRQKVHLEAARALQFTESEFLTALDMDRGSA